MTRSIMSLHPTLQAVWTAVYAAVEQGDRAALKHDEERTAGSETYTSDLAEQRAWEAVRRANGGVEPGVTPPAPTPRTDVNALLAPVGGVAGVAERLVALGYALVPPKPFVERTKADLEAEVETLRHAARNSQRDLSDLLGIVCGPGFVALSTHEDVIEALMPVVVEAMWGDATTTPYDPAMESREAEHARTALRNPDAPGLTDSDALIARVALAAATALNQRSTTAATIAAQRST